MGFRELGILFTLSTIIIPALAIVASLACLLLARRAARRRAWVAVSVVLALVALAVIGLRIYAGNIEPHRLVVRKVVITTDKVQEPLRILHVSDIQSAHVGSQERKLVDLIRRLKPDIVFNTGDILQPVPPASFASEVPPLAKLLTSAHPPLGTYWVRGNLDGSLAAEEFDRATGMHLLENEGIEVNAKGAKLRVYGMGLKQSLSKGGRAQVREWLASSGPDEFNVLLVHYSGFLLKIDDLPVDLCLSGHLHGGQVRVPFIGPIITLDGFPRRWSRGFNRIGDLQANISAGVGCEHGPWLPSIRFNCPPEITVIELVPRAARAPD